MEVLRFLLLGQKEVLGEEGGTVGGVYEFLLFRGGEGLDGGGSGGGRGNRFRGY